MTVLHTWPYQAVPECKILIQREACLEAYSVHTQFLIDIALLNHFQIGFNAGVIIDDNMTMVSRAARVNPEYEVQYKDSIECFSGLCHVTLP